jgi:hypothetical protein
VRACASLTVNSFWACPVAVAVLRPAQAFGLRCGIEHGLCPVGPGQQIARWLEARALAVRGNRQQAAFAFDHHAAGLAKRGGHQRNPRGGIVLCNRPHPFRPGAGLTKAAPGQDQPGLPVASGCQLAGMGPQPPVVAQLAPLPVAHPFERGAALARGERGEEGTTITAHPDRPCLCRHQPGWRHWQRRGSACRRSSHRSIRALRARCNCPPARGRAPPLRDAG